MNNKELLNMILKIRDIRTNLVNLNLNDKEKEILRQSLNYYEDELNLDITRNNLNKYEFDEQEISNDIEIVDIPIEKNTTKYVEFAKVNSDELIPLISNISNAVNTLGLDINEVVIILKSLKEYSEYLKQMELTRKNNQDLYTEIMFEKNTSQK